MDVDRLAKLMRMVLGATTDGEQLGAIAAFKRAMEADGLDLHDIVGRFELGGAASSDAARATSSDEAAADWVEVDGLDATADWFDAAAAGMNTRNAFDPNYMFQAAMNIAARQSDSLWPDLAWWILREDDAWRDGHGRWLLNGRQRQFCEGMREEAQTVRPTLRQCAWLICLFSKVIDQRDRPEPPPAGRLGRETGRRTYPTRELPPARRKKAPERVIGRKDQVGWIHAVISARRQGSRPVEDAAQPALFSDLEVRVLAWLAASFKAWVIDRSHRAKDPFVIDQAQSAVEMAAGACVSLRSVRRTLRRAVMTGYLTVERPGLGRGKRTIYRLTFPPAGWRHEHVPVAQPRRQAHRQRALSTRSTDLAAD